MTTHQINQNHQQETTTQREKTREKQRQSTPQSKPEEEERKNQNQIQKSNKHQSEAENPEHLWKTTSTQQCTAGTATGISSNIISITQMSRIQEHIFRSTTNIPVEPPRCKGWEHSVEVHFPGSSTEDPLACQTTFKMTSKRSYPT